MSWPRVTVAIATLVVGAVALAAVPSTLDASYSWQQHTTSEAAGQGVQGAWLARAGFLAFGLAVLFVAAQRDGPWRRPVALLHSIFGVCLIAAAAFASRPWDPSLPYDRFEDVLHSVAATAMGFAFSFGVVAVVMTSRVRPVDVIAVSASVVLPLVMVAEPEIAGTAQRLMFAVAVTWYGGQVLGSSTTTAVSPVRRAA